VIKILPLDFLGYHINLVPRDFSLAWGLGGKRPFPAPPPSQEKVPGNEAGYHIEFHERIKTPFTVCKYLH